MNNNVLTSSRMGCLLRCPRAHFWQYEIGLRRAAAGLALRFGSAWHRAMEARWNDATYEEALGLAIPDGIDLDAYTCATLAGLLAGYYAYYGEVETVGKLHPEIEFSQPLARSRTFSVAGVIDGLGSLRDGRSVLVESKTTGDSVSPESDYWLRLRFNPQVYQYAIASRALGWHFSEVLYDVTRKPSIRPKSVNDLDGNGCKIVLDLDGNRVFKKNGEARETADTEKGWVVKAHIETPDEFNTRLTEDVKARPEFYFCRKEVPVLEDDLAEFEAQRLTLARMILHCRNAERKLGKREQAWPRAVADQNCKFCAYSSFCLQNISPDLNMLPEGFEIQGFNPELDTSVTEETTTP